VLGALLGWSPGVALGATRESWSDIIAKKLPKV
jgi:hypothetical protein